MKQSHWNRSVAHDAGAEPRTVARTGAAARRSPGADPRDRLLASAGPILRPDWEAVNRTTERKDDTPGELAEVVEHQAPERTGIGGENTGVEPAEARPLLQRSVPIFGYVACLPLRTFDEQPDYSRFRSEVVSALDRVLAAGRTASVSEQDARLAHQALCLFVDERVAGSRWDGRETWATEPLTRVRSCDPKGGVHFFERLDGLGRGQSDVAEVYLTCLALGYRGRFAGADAIQQQARLEELRLQTVRKLDRERMVERDVLFPEAYVEVEGMIRARKRRRWLGAASITATVAALILAAIIVWAATYSPLSALSALQRLQLETPAEAVEVDRE